MKPNEIDSVLNELDWKSPAVISNASQWILDQGIISDFHKNTLVLGVMGEDKRIKDVEFFIQLPVGEERGIMVCRLYLTRVSLIFSNTRKLSSSILLKLNNLLKNYDVCVEFKIWKKNKESM